MSDSQEEGWVGISSKTESTLKVVENTEGAIAREKMHSGEAAKIRGQVNWLDTLAAGRCGRIGTRVLARKQYGNDLSLSQDDIESLRFLCRVALTLPPKHLHFFGRRAPPCILYTDASQEENCPITIGWVCFRQRQTIGSSAVIPQKVVDTWIPRATDIYAGEAFAVLAALWQLAPTMRDQDLIIFVDNEAAAAAMIRGASSSDDVGAVARATHMLALSHGIRFWIEWIDSKSNPSDGLSRLGFKDPWTLAQGWMLVDPILPPWDDLKENDNKLVQGTLGLEAD